MSALPWNVVPLRNFIEPRMDGEAGVEVRFTLGWCDRLNGYGMVEPSFRTFKDRGAALAWCAKTEERFFPSEAP